MSDRPFANFSLAELRTETELLNALMEAVKAAEHCSKKLALFRDEGRWSQIGMLMGAMYQKVTTLANSRRMPSLLTPDGRPMN